jgi:hypothetical protein
MVVFFNLHATAMDVELSMTQCTCLVARRSYFLYATVAGDLSLLEKTVDQALFHH